MKYCERCGRELSDGALFCPACGAAAAPGGAAGDGRHEYPAGGPAAAATTPTPPPPTCHPPVSRPAGGVWKKVVAIVAVILLLLGAGAAVAGIFIFRAVKAPVDVTNRYIEAVNEGRANDAWDLLHSQSRLKRDYDRVSYGEEVVKANKGKLRTWNAGK